MELQQLAVATLTWARDAAEEKLIRDALEQLASFNIPVYITDGGSGEGFLQFVRSFPQFHLLPSGARGAWAQTSNSLAHAYESEVPFILYTESDKLDFFTTGLPQLLKEVSVNEKTGVVVAARSAKGFATFPSFQQMTETTINNCCTEVIGLQADFTYGPFLLHRNLVTYTKLLQEDAGWGWRPFLFSVARRAGYTVEAFTGDFHCPVDQRDDNPKERIYRMKQLMQNIQGITLSTAVDVGAVKQ